MDRIAPKPPIAIEGPVIRNSIEPAHLDQQITATSQLFVLAHAGIPSVSVNDWALEVCGLVTEELSLTLDDLMRYPQHSVEAIHKCAGNPFEPAQPSRQIANVME
jgi:DMSO/TMAO reductase YedYZ molybdopterin-dependent catalytic subunit